MKKWFTLLAVLFIVFLFASQPVTIERANALSIHDQPSTLQRNAPDCFALDIVFVIDQSKSMSQLPRPNDPLGQRFNAPRYALDWLANNRLSRLAQCPDAVHRIGVISFGTDVVVDLPLTIINPSSQKEWDALLPELEAKIQERDMGTTDQAKAMIEAARVLKTADALGDLPRKRAVILLTDGQPCTVELGCIDGTSGTTKGTVTYEKYMHDLFEQTETDFTFSPSVVARDQAIKDAIERFGGLDKISDEERDRIYVNYPVSNQELYNSIYIWIMATNDATKYSSLVGDNFKAIATSHNSELIDIQQNLLEIPKVFNQIMSTLAGVKPTLLGCGNLAVDPYLSGVVLDIYKAANGLEVEISYNNKHLKDGDGDKDFFGLAQYSQYGAVEHYRFQTPPAGLWEIVCSDPNGAEVSYLPFDAHAELVQPSSILPQYDVNNEHSDPLHPFYLTYKVVDQIDAKPLNLDTAYPLNMSGVVVDPAGTKYSLELEFMGDGVWQSREPLPVNILGKYQVTLTADAPCVVDPDKPDRCPQPRIEVVPSTVDHYDVGAISLFRIKVIEPEPSSRVPLHGPLLPDWLPVEPLVVHVQLTDLDNNPIQAADVLSGDVAQAITATLSSGGIDSTLPLNPDPTDPSRFSALFDTPALLGEQVLTVTLGDDYLFEKYRPQESSVSISFLRKDPLWRNPMFYRLLVAMLVLVIGGFLVYFSWLKTFPLRGSLNFMKKDDKGQRTALVGLARGKRRIKLTKAAIPADLRNDFKKIVVTNQPPKGRMPNLLATVLVKPDGREHKVMDGKSSTDKGWTFTYNLGVHAVQKDRFWIWALVVCVLDLIALVGIFSL